MQRKANDSYSVLVGPTHALQVSLPPQFLFSALSIAPMFLATLLST
jgi:hypothetical protein